MDRKTRENLLAALEEDWGRFKKPVLWGLFALFLWIGVSMLFHNIDVALSSVQIKGYDKGTEVVTTDEAGNEVKEFIPAGSHLSIPKLGVQAPITFVQSTRPGDFLGPLKKGVTHYPSSMPGDQGASIILGHSAPPGIFGAPFDGIFSNLKDLVPGDNITVYHEGKAFRYVVEKQELLQRGQDIPETSLDANQSKLLLLSCWPPGIDNKRIMVQAQII